MRENFKNRSKNRYIKVNGDPIHLPLLLGIWKNADTKITGAVVALSMATAYYMGATPDTIKMMAVDSAFGFAMFQVMDRSILRGMDLRRHFGKAAHVCIDRKPNPFSPKTDPKYMLAAERMRLQSLLGVLAFGLVATLFYKNDLMNCVDTIMGGADKEAMKTGMFTLAFSTQWLSRDLLSAHRFNKVAKGEWTIVDTPAQKQKRESWLGRMMPGGL